MLITILEQGIIPTDIQTVKEEVSSDFKSYIEEMKKGFVSSEDRKITLLEDKQINNNTHFFQYFVEYGNGTSKTINRYVMNISDTLDFSEPSLEKNEQLTERGVFVPQSLLDYSIPRKLSPILSYANEDKKLDSLSDEELNVLNRAFNFISTIHTAGSALDMCRNLEINTKGQHGAFNHAVRSTQIALAHMGHRVITTYHGEVTEEKD